MLDEKEAALLVEREARKNDLLLMKAMDKNNAFGVERHEITNVLLECNLRIIQYVYQFKAFSLDFLILQTIQDFKNYYVVLQNKKLDKSKPVFMLRDEQNTKIYVNPAITKLSFEEGGVMLFSSKQSESE